VLGYSDPCQPEKRAQKGHSQNRRRDAITYAGAGSY
jgi:hypothetical protein